MNGKYFYPKGTTKKKELKLNDRSNKTKRDSYFLLINSFNDIFIGEQKRAIVLHRFTIIIINMKMGHEK